MLAHLFSPAPPPRTVLSSPLRLRLSAARDPDRHHHRRRPDRNLLKAKDVALHNNNHHLLASSVPPLLPQTLDPSSLLPDQALGLVVSAQANFMRVVVLDSPAGTGEELLCVVRALLKKIKRRVLVGDKVLVGSVDWVEKRGMIEEVFGRGTELVDPPVANADHLVVLFAIEEPKIEPFTLTRFLVEAESIGIPVTLVVNKTELASEETIVSWEERLHLWGYQPIFCSVEKTYGLASLMGMLEGRTTVIVGPSGVGKSSLINAVRGNPHNSDGADIQNLLNYGEGNKWFEYQPVGAVSKRSGRGKHTTRHVSLLPLAGGGYLADTPGFNQPTLTKVTKKSLAGLFPEIRQMIATTEPFSCSFNDCLHIGEPGCLVTGGWERYPYYLQLLDEIKTREELELRTFGTKRESDVRYKVGQLGIKQAEPRLNIKKHRRVSRKRLNQSLLDDIEECWDGDDD